MQLELSSIGANQKTYAEVALPLPLRTTFTYLIPPELTESVNVGTRVHVPFGRRELSGIVVEIKDATSVTRTKPIKSVSATYLTGNLLRLTEWMSSYYGCSFGEAAQSVLPPSLKASNRKSPLAGTLVIRDAWREDDDGRQGLERARRQRQLLDRLRRAGGRMNVATVTGEWGFQRAQVEGLLGRGIVELVESERISTLDRMDIEVLKLNTHQERCLAEMVSAIDAASFRPLLLYGVTGSGKTELYLRAARHVLAQGGGCIVLVPEIGLLPQAVARYRRVFGDTLAVLHSRLTGPERFDIWRRVEHGECRLVLGPRSAIFSPVRDLRMIIVDEEQDDSYKQDEKPRYHARAVAMMRGKYEGLTVVLGSATPAAETMHHARTGAYSLLALPERAGGTHLPDIEFVDLREAEMAGAFFSSRLVERIADHLARERQVILFLNRRGHARFIQCNACGHVERCENCDISLVYHRVPGRIKCHFCGYDRVAPRRCNSCGSTRLYFSGAGTQRVELDLAGLFPGVGILRMDADTTAGKDGHRKILEKFGSGRYPILIGTQMVAKGHHFPDVSLVGVLFAEDSLNYPDFRSAERTFQQLTQVSGRAGRAGAAGEVVIQTFQPEHPVFQFLRAHDYDGFMDGELELRRELGYPPFSRLILASCSAARPDTLAVVVQRWVEHVRRLLAGSGAIVMGPVPPVIPRVRNRYREHVLIKGRVGDAKKSEIIASFDTALNGVRGGSTVELRWDVDPESFS